MTDLDGRRIAVLTAQVGVEKAELAEPWTAIEEAAGTPVLIAPEPGQVQSMVGDVELDATFDVDQTVADTTPDGFAGLVLPGGTVNADRLRLDAAGVDLVRDFIDAGVPVAAICHAPWTLIEAADLQGKTLTSYPSLRTDLINAGATWVDREVVVCTAEDWTLITSRNPGDLDAFCSAALECFAEM